MSNISWVTSFSVTIKINTPNLASFVTLRSPLISPTTFPDIRAVVDNHDFQSIIEEESGRSSSVDYLDTYEDIPKEAAREYTGDTKEELFEEEKETETFVENEIKPIETEKKEATRAGSCRAVIRG